MEIISHRGFWINNEEKNQLPSFERSFSLGYGTETDIRDCNGTLVISHDIPHGNEMTFDSFLELYIKNKCTSTIALNIKADGLQEKIAHSINKYKIKNSFVFDMSIPDELAFMEKTSLSVFSRCSEFEKDVSFYDKCAGVWLDCFESVWYNSNIIRSFLNDGKSVCLVSSELHKRKNYLEHWTLIKEWGLVSSKGLILCTDFPQEANKFFKEDL